MSYHRLNTKPLNATLSALLKRGAHLGVGVGAMAPMLALAAPGLPTGGQVVGGQATISNPGSNGVVVKQTSASAIINWQQFNIGKGQYVQFIQPSSSSVVLNRVVGGSASSIFGSLTGNGQVFLVNTNGVFFGRSATLDLQGFLASTLDISDGNFLSGHYVFDQPGASGAEIINQGKLRAHNGGYIILAGDYAENDGLISAQSGHVILASGAKTTLNLNGNQLVNFAVNTSTLASFAGVENTGKLIADGGTVIMTADVANLLKSTVVNNTGLIEAHAINKSGGTISLTATGGDLQNSGTLDADATKAGQQGGTITLKGDEKTLLNPTSNITATGDMADGGHLEVSGNTIAVRGITKLGKGGNLLLDPSFITLIAGSVSGSVGLGTGATGENGNVNVEVGFVQNQLNSGVNVNIFAHKEIKASGVTAITATGTKAGNLTLKVASGAQIALGGVDITIAGALTASFGYGSFGYLQAKTIALHGGSAASEWIQLKPAVTSGGGAVTKYSARATGGDILISGFNMFGSNLALKAKAGVNLGIDIGTSGHVFNGNVSLVGATVSDGEHIINANGDIGVTASNGYAHLDHLKGQKVTLSAAKAELTATGISANGGVTLTDTSGDVHVGAVNNGNSNVNITATGGGTISAGNIAEGSGDIDITDTGAKTILHQLANDHGNLTVNAKGQVLSFDSSNGANPIVNISGNATLTAKTVTQTGNEFVLVAGGNLTVNGLISLASNHSSISSVAHQVAHDLSMKAGGTIKLDHSIVVPGAVTLTGGHLVFTGGKTFTVSAGYGGNLTLDASIGSAAAPVKYNVDLLDKGWEIFVQRSIYTGATAGGLAANIAATQTGTHHGGPGYYGVLLGDSQGQAVTLSTKGSVTLKGKKVSLGDASNGSNDFGAVTVKAGKSVAFSASVSASHGFGTVAIVPQHVAITGGSTDKSILVQAGGSLKLKGAHVKIDGAAGSASVSVAHSGAATVKTGVTLKAGGSVNIDAGAGNASLQAGQGFATAKGSSGKTRDASVDTSVNITAGKAITISAHNINLSGGYGVARASAGENAVDTAVATTDVSLKAGTNISVTAHNSGSIVIAGAGNEGFNGSANGHGAKATATAHGDVSLKSGATGGIALKGRNIHLQAGGSAGIHVGTGADARASNGSAQFTVTADVSLAAGSGGITLTGSAGSGSIEITGGNDAGRGAKVFADSGTAGYKAEARVDLTATNGTITVTGHKAKFSAGVTAGFGGSATAGESGNAQITADGGVSLAATNIQISGSNSLSFHGGSQAGKQVSAKALEATAVADVNASANLSLTAKSALKVNTTAGNVMVHGQRSVGSGDVAKASAGAATVAAAGNVSLKGASVTLTALTGSVILEAGYGAADVAGASAHSGGQAAVDAEANLSVTATAGGVTVKGKTNAQLTAGQQVAQGRSSFHSHSSGFISSGGVSASHFSDVHFSRGLKVDYTQAAAFGSGAKATVTGAGTVSLNATGAISLTGGTGNVNLEAGYGAAGTVRTLGSGGGSARVSALVGIHIKAGGGVTLNGKGVNVAAGGSAAHGAASSFSSKGVFHHGFGGSHFTVSASFHNGADGQEAKGAGAHANLTADNAVTIQGASLSLTAAASSVDIGGGGAAASHAKASASNGGAAGLDLTGGVTLTATNGVTVTAAHNLNIGGAFRSGEAVLTATGKNATATLTAAAGFNIAAANVALAAGHSLQLMASESAGYGAQVKAGANGVVDESVTAGIDITAKTSFKATLTGSGSGGKVLIRSAGRDGRAAHVTADSGGRATLTAQNDVGIQVTGAGGALAVSTGKHHNASLSISGGSRVAQSAHVAASHGTASLDVSGGISLSAKGAVSVNDQNGKLYVAGARSTLGPGEGLGDHAIASAGVGGRATLSAAQNISINGGSVSVKAGKGLTVFGDPSFNGDDASAHALDGAGTADLTLSADVTMKATGTLSLTAGSDLLIAGARDDNGINAKASASGSGAKADLRLTDSVLLSGNTGVSLKAGHSIQVAGNTDGAMGRSASVKAGTRAGASIDQVESVTITTGGVFAAIAGKALSFSGADQAGDFVKVAATGAGAQAAYHGDGTVNVSAHSIQLSGSDVLAFGRSNAAEQAHVTAKQGGTANLTADAGLDFTAVTGFSAKLTGSAANGELEFFNGRNDGHSALATASNVASKANVAASESVNIIVTGATGTISLSTGNRTNADLYVGGSTGAGQNAGAKAFHGGSAGVTADNNVTLSAKGAVTLNAVKGHASLIAGWDRNGASEFASASTGAKAKVTTDSNLNITGGTVSVHAGTNLLVFAGRDSNASGADATAKFGGSASGQVNTELNVKALVGALTMTAGSNISIEAAHHHNGSLVSIDAGHGGARANLSVDEQLQLSGATAVTLTAGKNLAIAAGSSSNNAVKDGVHASYGGKANLSENGNLTIVTPGAFSAKAGGTLDLTGASNFGHSANVTAVHAGAKAGADLEGTTTINAKTIALAAGTSLDAHGGSHVASHAFASADYGGAAAITTKTGVQLDAKSAVTMTLTGSAGGGKLLLNGGDFGAAFADASVGSYGGTANIGVDSGVSVSVTALGGVITLTAGKHPGAHMSLDDAQGVGSHAQAAAEAGSASLTATGNVNLGVNGAITLNAGAGGVFTMEGGRSDAHSANVTASNGAHASATIESQVNVSGSTVTLTAGKTLTLAGGGVSAGKAARIDASHSGSAALDLTVGLNITAAGAFTANAGSDMLLTGNGFGSSHVIDQDMGSAMKLTASNGGARATFTGVGGMDITAGAVTLKAGKHLVITGANGGGKHASVSAHSSSDNAAFSATDDLDITAKGALSMTAVDGLIISGGNGLASQTVVDAAAAGANASLAAEGSINFTAGGAFTVKAANVILQGGGSLGKSVTEGATGRGAQASVRAGAGVNFTAATLSVTATSSNVTVHGGSGLASGAKISGATSGHAAYAVDGTVTLHATGAASLTATVGSLDISGGAGSFVFSAAQVKGHGNNGTAAFDAENGVSVTAGGTLSLKAGSNLTVAGGHAEFASAQASSGGSAQVKLGTGIVLKAGTTLNLTAAGGSLAIHGGHADGLLLNTFFNPGGISHSSSIVAGPAGGKVGGQLDASVSLTAGGDVNLKAANNLTVAAGAGATLAVGALREFSSGNVSFHGKSWGGGSAQATADLGVVVTAGHNLSLTAGTIGSGSIKVLGLGADPAESSGFFNMVSVRGGSNHATAKLSLDANALLTAGNDVVVNAKGNASVVGGSLFSLIADHTKGNVSITGSADATVHAGHDVVLNNVTGNLTVAGFMPGSSHANGVSIAAIGHGGLAAVTGHADGAITAGDAIRTVTALGGSLDITGGQKISVDVPGPKDGVTGVNSATVTADASLSAGNNVTLVVKGNLNVRGGGLDAVGAGTMVSASNSVTSRTAKLDATAGITAGKALALSVTGNASIDGGETVNVSAGFKNGSFVKAQASGDVSVSITGASLSLVVGKALTVRGGTSAVAHAKASGASSLRATANANADASLTATGNLTLSVGLANHGNAAFIAGSHASGRAVALGSSALSASAEVHSDVNVKAGGNLSLTVGGGLTVTGGAHTETAPSSADVGALAKGSSASAQLRATTKVTADVGFNAGGALTITLKGGSVAVTGGNDVGAVHSVTTSHSGHNAAVLDAEAEVSLHAGGALKLTGATAVALNAGAFAAGSSKPVVTSGAGTASETLSSGIQISGNTVNINAGLAVTPVSFHTLTTGGLFQDGRVSITAVSSAPVFSAPAPLNLPLPGWRDVSMSIVPGRTTDGFGGVQVLSDLPGATFSGGTTSQPFTLNQSGLWLQPAGTSLGSLQDQGLVVNLVTLLAPPAEPLSATTLYVPVDSGRLTPYTGPCATQVQRSDGHYRCGARDK